MKITGATMTITLKIFVHYRRKESWEDPNSPPNFVVFSSDMSDYGYTLLSELEVSFTPPEDFNPVSAEVAAIEAAKSKAVAVYHESVKHLNDQLSKWLAITNEVAS